LTGKQNQHYVPRFLLKRFADGNKKSPHIWVYDKGNREPYFCPIRKVATEEGYYRFTREDGTEVDLEGLLERVDSEGARVVAATIASQRLPSNASDRKWMAVFVTCQMLRTQGTRRAMEAFRLGIMRKFGSDVVIEGDDRPIRELGSITDRAGAIRMILEALPLSEHLSDKAWFLSESPVSHPFILSDNPVVRHNHLARPGRADHGLRQSGIEVTLPISPRLAVHFLCQDVASVAIEDAAFRSAIEDGAPLQLSPENVEFINHLQVKWADRFVYARRREELSLAMTMIAEEPRLIAPPVPVVE
jgi:hypothetical protein